jgi:hypothetical protein
MSPDARSAEIHAEIAPPAHDSGAWRADALRGSPHAADRSSAVFVLALRRDIPIDVAITLLAVAPADLGYAEMMRWSAKLLPLEDGILH